MDLGLVALLITRAKTVNCRIVGDQSVGQAPSAVHAKFTGDMVENLGRQAVERSFPRHDGPTPAGVVASLDAWRQTRGLGLEPTLDASTMWIPSRQVKFTFPVREMMEMMRTEERGVHGC